MHDPRQDDDLDLSPSTGLCLSCGKRRVLCAHACCRQCHLAPHHATWQGVARDRPLHLCCGWYATGMLLEDWTCLTCGAVRRRDRHA